MARGSRQAEAGMTTAQDNANTYGANAGSLFSTLSPDLQAQAANPQGYNPADVAKMTTAAAQTAGGSNAGAVGSAGLRAARTRNAGGGDAAIAESARDAGETLSKGVLGVQINNAQLKQRQQQEALGEMGGLYGTNVQGGNQALGEIAPLQRADTGEENASYNWATQLMEPMWENMNKSGEVVAKMMGGMMKPGGG